MTTTLSTPARRPADLGTATSTSAPPRSAATLTLAWIRRHPVPAFYILSFAISWTSILLIIGGPFNLPGSSQQIQVLFLPVMLGWLAGPSVTGILLTGLVSGRAGYRDLRARIFRWRVDRRWYAIALVTAPCVYLSLSGLLSLLSADFVPAIIVSGDKWGLTFMGLAYGLFGGGVLEELGWTGFATPRLRQRFGIVATGLSTGLLWGAYHFSVIFWSTSPPPQWPLGISILLFQLFAWLPAYRILMVWVYDRTQSVLLAMLMHASLTAGMLILQPAGPLMMTGQDLLVWLVAFSAAWWLIVLAGGLLTKGYRSGL